MEPICTFKNINVTKSEDWSILRSITKENKIEYIGSLYAKNESTAS